MKNNYFVIGGEHGTCCYGGATTLKQATKLARESEEYWDNRSFHIPAIYLAEDTEEIETETGLVRYPKEDAIPQKRYYPMRTLKGLNKAVKEYNRYLYDRDWNATLFLNIRTGKMWTDVEYGDSWNRYDDPEIVNVLYLIPFESEADADVIKDYCRKHFNLKGWGEKE